MKSTQKVRIETPIGSVESDSGNHMIDVFSVIIIIAVAMLFKKLWSK
tara:strand:- start:10398 stop:10538 length:141 start_codon:yes stop_codon:yes gene_type:complete